MKECLASLRTDFALFWAEYHLCYVFNTKRWVSDTETVIIPGKISVIPPQVTPSGRDKMPEAPLL
ncbi:hypothetical protein E2C01_049720 [Portunus trituberculatus]|uniref:Uncharacterized protein n=1 Tax=Portunus trituberculatus TaxID=210409 RepID=A0A5B7GDY6_PORTR|nr:hypothetical protein [Portunus trituberculatus]